MMPHRSVPCSSRSAVLSPRSPAMAHMTKRASMTPSPSVIPLRRSSYRPGQTLGLSHIREQLEEERLVPSREVHLASDRAWQRVRAQDVERHASNDGEVAGRVVLSASGVVLAEDHVELAVEVVLHAPVPSRDR